MRFKFRAAVSACEEDRALRLSSGPLTAPPCLKYAESLSSILSVVEGRLGTVYSDNEATSLDCDADEVGFLEEGDRWLSIDHRAFEGGLFEGVPVFIHVKSDFGEALANAIIVGPVGIEGFMRLFTAIASSPFACLRFAPATKVAPINRIARIALLVPRFILCLLEVVNSFVIHLITRWLIRKLQKNVTP